MYPVIQVKMEAMNSISLCLSYKEMSTFKKHSKKNYYYYYYFFFFFNFAPPFSERPDIVNPNGKRPKVQKNEVSYSESRFSETNSRMITKEPGSSKDIY